MTTTSGASSGQGLVARLAATLRDDGPLGWSLTSVVLVAAWVSTWRPLVDPDAWWHLAIGERILAGDGLPATEPFSWLTSGQPFVAHSWLWDALSAAAYGAGGATGISLLGAIVTAAIVVLLFALVSAVAPSTPPLGRAGLVLVATVAALPIWAPRAGLWDVALALATVLAVERYLRGGSRLALVAIPVIGLVWANFHGSGILALAACLAAAVIAAPVGRRWGVWPARPILPLVLAGFLGLAATAIGPYGPRLFLYPVDASVASAFDPRIVEWQSPDFGDPALWLARIILAGGLLVAVGLTPGRRDPLALLLAAGWSFAALGAVRFLPLAAAFVVVALAPALGLAARTWGGRTTKEAGETEVGVEAGAAGAGATAAPRPRSMPAVIVGVVAGLVIVAIGWTFIAPAAQDAAIARRQPVAAVAALLAASGCDARLLPAYEWGGYVAWATGRPVAAYGNSPASALGDQAGVESLAVDPTTWLDARGVDIVLMPATRPLARWLDQADGWRRAGGDDAVAILVRADSACQLGAS